MNNYLVKNGLPKISSNILFPSLFIFIGLLGVFNHSLWRDEMQGWLVARHSQNFVDLWLNNAPSGHPIIWSALIFCVKGLTNTPLSMQLLQWTLGSLSIICFWKWNPFPVFQKILFTFGYFPFWEYFFISRHYVVVELLTIIFCSSFHLRRKSYIPASILIGLLVNTHAFAWSIAFAIGFSLLVEWIFSSFHRKIYKKNKYWILDLTISILIIISFVGFAGFSLFQVRDSASVNFLEFDLRHLLRTFGRVFGGYLLVVPNYKRWIDLAICAIIACLMLTITVRFLKRSKIASIFFLSGIGSLLTFNYFIYLGVGSRHYGYYFLIFIASIWMALHPSENPKAIISNSLSLKRKGIELLFPLLLTLSLSVHFIAGIHRTTTDFFVPYSAAKATAKYMDRQGLKDADIFATRDVEVSTITGYLNREFYYPELKGLGSYAKWRDRNPINREDVIDEVEAYLFARKDLNKLLLVISKAPLDIDNDFKNQIIYKNLKIEPIKKFLNSWIDTERYYLYWVERIQ